MKILVPLDGSDTSQRILPYLKGLAPAWKAQLTLLRVVDPLSFHSPAVDESEHWGAAAAQQAEAYLKERVEELAGLAVQALVHRGGTCPSICQVAQQCDLIAFAPHNQAGLERWIYGSVSEEVIRDAPCPVFLLRGETNVRFHHLLLPVDASEASLEVCRRAQAFVPEDVRVTLLHCHGSQQMDDRWTRAFEAVIDGKQRWELICRPGKAPAAILEWFTHCDCDLIAMATRGRKGWDHFWRGSVTEQVARHAPCPTLVFPPASLDCNRNLPGGRGKEQ
ncbi:universal stress protein [bacterium]|nr:universal stress protein [bacterium]